MFLQGCPRSLKILTCNGVVPHYLFRFSFQACLQVMEFLHIGDDGVAPDYGGEEVSKGGPVFEAAGELRQLYMRERCSRCVRFADLGSIFMLFGLALESPRDVHEFYLLLQVSFFD